MYSKWLLSLGLLASVGLSAASPTVYLIRHGEKPDDGGTGLNAQGLKRAQCLRKVFGGDSPYQIGYIMAQKPKKNGKRARPYDTVHPLAEDLGLTVDTSCDRDDAGCVKDAVHKYDGKGNILICWEHKKLTDIVAELGDGDAPEYPSESFDLIWTDPSPYSNITEITSEHCPGLDGEHGEDHEDGKSEGEEGKQSEDGEDHKKHDEHEGSEEYGEDEEDGEDEDDE
ncbi:hypothetical protein EYZ11_006478 [Aspergillus tanneri]|uniref:Phosphoglycerate mutase family protein n=1 Tax=Aspergillus tanneri TaxID=1220188 RepID=A0A4S3JFB5_9EURO|nr:uncharacterized protein ATNIH1004_010755 [Aspergillus tanneri]KAA8641816.1 hypothetical protein ATNIH1004_010755 [Aspergillus tanneri]THC94036.1 hypothetical protein EYZ11_006478 [Aspergillus tanneri]